MPIATLLWANRTLIAGAVLAAVLWGLWAYCGHLRARLADAEQANAIYAQTIDALKAENKRALWRAKNAEKLKGQIANAQDAPLAPALRIALDGLRADNAAKGSR